MRISKPPKILKSQSQNVIDIKVTRKVTCSCPRLAHVFKNWLVFKNVTVCVTVLKVMLLSEKVYDTPPLTS